MDSNMPPENEIRDEFRNLGRNIADTLRSAWESPERQKLQQELESGLDEFAASLRKEAQEFSSSQTGQQLKADLNDLKERIHSGEAEAKARDEILNIIRTLNTELEKWKAGRNMP